jgi:predicted RNA-binding Zn ribbon-like protein
MQSLSELPFVAGHAGLDFVNTAEQRGHPDAGDVLVTPADLRLWGQRYGLISPSVRGEGDERAELDQARQARELLYAVLLDRIHDRPASKAQLNLLARSAAEAYAAASLQMRDDGSLGWHWSPSQLSTIRHVAVTSAVDLLRSEPSTRLKQCPGDRCGWLFLDATKGGNRRWCSMSECGQDAKDAQRARRRASHRAGHDVGQSRSARDRP